MENDVIMLYISSNPAADVCCLNIKSLCGNYNQIIKTYTGMYTQFTIHIEQQKFAFSMPD